MASVIGNSIRVVDEAGLAIDELAGNVATRCDTISIAYVIAKAGSSEPFLTLAYDEWICVRSGKVVIKQDGRADVIATAGQTIFVPKTTRFQPSFPEDTEYIPVCLPAFTPDRCVREDSGVDRLKNLHAAAKEESKPELLYHMTTVAAWEEAKKAGIYYPETYEKDGFYTHATGVPSRLLSTANHFYQDVQGDWVCLSFTRTALWKKGIHVRDEAAMPVGDKQVGSEWSNWVCPHVIGGIPTDIVDTEFAMERSGTKFVAITGLC